MVQESEMTVVVPVRRAEETIGQTLEQLLARSGLEVIAAVSRNDPARAVIERLKQTRPALTVLVMEGQRSVPELRAEGIRAARGRLVAITEDHCTFSETWPAALAPPLDDPQNAASGGAVINGRTQSLAAWAIFFSRYVSAMPPVRRGPVAALPGNNACYRRETLEAARDLYRDGFWEHEFHQQLLRQGYRLWLEPDAAVRHNKPYRAWPYAALRFHHGRCYGGMMAGNLSLGARLTRILLSPAIPLLMTLRASRTVAAKKRYLMRFVLSLPFLVAFYAAWAAGELAGYLAGPGNACSQTD